MDHVTREEILTDTAHSEGIYLGYGIEDYAIGDHDRFDTASVFEPGVHLLNPIGRGEEPVFVQGEDFPSRTLQVRIFPNLYPSPIEPTEKIKLGDKR